MFAHKDSAKKYSLPRNIYNNFILVHNYAIYLAKQLFYCIEELALSKVWIFVTLGEGANLKCHHLISPNNYVYTINHCRYWTNV